MSPFFAGLPLFYHFFFNFWTAMWEYFGVPIVWAVNIPSILSFAAMLIVIYYLPQILGKQKPLVGWIAVLLTITNSSLTFWKLLPDIGSIWRLPTYPFSGPYDGSMISIYMTLNNYVNQRHLAFGMALGLLLIMLFTKQVTARLSRRGVLFIGILTGVMFLWNIPLFFLVSATIASIFMFRRKWILFVVYWASALISGFVFFWPYIGLLPQISALFHALTGNVSRAAEPTWNIFSYLWQNLGILPIFCLIGYFAMPKKYRVTFWPFIILFAVEIINSSMGHRGFEQKSLSFLIKGLNILTAVGVVRIWQKNKLFAVVCIFVVTVSGFVDLMPIKNEFAFPLIGKEMVPLISWIRTSTPKDSVFVSYSDIIDPVVLAGRKNYFGFFGNIGWYDRTSDVARIYSGDKTFAKIKNISYILVPKWKKADFVYSVHLNSMRVMYEDAKYRVYAVE
jgi:hypothetical protein